MLDYNQINPEPETVDEAPTPPSDGGRSPASSEAVSRDTTTTPETTTNTTIGGYTSDSGDE